MAYAEFLPHPALTAYIDAYWIAENQSSATQTSRILPDGCVDLIFNLQNDCKSASGTILMKSETIYLIGTMTTFKESIQAPETKLLGVRFKPAAFSSFYSFSSLHEFTDQNIEFEKAFAPDLYQVKKHADVYLNQFFLDKLTIHKHQIFPVINDINLSNGQLKVKDLCEKHFITCRQLERQFRYHVGLSPKEFINLVRYQFTHNRIKNNIANKALAEIAFECGYYDHSHLTNALKKYTGLVPSEL